jgi:hypothetical protein
MDLYDVLNISPTASVEEVRNGYLTMSRIHHPDKSVGSQSTEAFRNINQAYTILSDPTLREFYDKHGLDATLLAQEDVTGDLEKFSLVPSTEKLANLQERVKRLVRSSEELNAQRFLQPSGSITIGTRILSYNPFYRSWSHSATSFGVSVYSAGKHSLSLYSSSHVQRGGAAITRASFILGTALSPSITTRSIVHFMGGRWPALELMVQKSLTDRTVVRQTLAFDSGSFVVNTEWIQQLAEALIGTLGVSLGASRGMSIELAKKLGGSFLPDWRGKLRFGLSTAGEVSIGGKAKFKAGEGLEFHAGPNVNLAKGSVDFELAVQTELEPIVKEQEGAFPTMLTWSIALELPDEELTVGIKLSRGGYTFHFPIQLPAPETKWALIGALAVWTFSPLCVRTVKRLLAKRPNASEEKPVVEPESDLGESERCALRQEASDRRAKEQAVNGLVIIEAKYADQDVTDVLMARVRDGQLSLSSNTKSKLVGIRYPTPGHDLFVRYMYGTKSYDRVFRDSDIVLLP